MKAKFCALFLLACMVVPPGQPAATAAQTAGWSATGALITARTRHTATVLLNGKVLVVGGSVSGAALTGSAELYDPATGTWSLTGNLNIARTDHTAVKLLNGKVLVVGGVTTSPVRSLTSTELYDPQTGMWSLSGEMSTGRQNPLAVLLQNGKVLVAAGLTQPGATFNRNAEVYDLTTGQWSPAGTLNDEHGFATLSLLPNGRALLVAGLNTSGSTRNCELYNPATNTWTPTGALSAVRTTHAATLLPNGKVLVSGGRPPDVAETELYDPATGQWTVSGNLATARGWHTATLLPNGKVLIAGGQGTNNISLKSAALYDPATASWTGSADLNQARDHHTATLLPNGKVLVAGGGLFTGSGLITPLASAELFDSGTSTIASVSAASFTVGGAPESIVAAFGANLAASVQAASSTPLPTELAGVSVRVRDSVGVERPAPLFFVAPNQINFLLPANTAPGTTYLTVSSGASGVIEIASTAPGLFAANANGQGVAAAVALRVRGDGSQSYEAVARLENGRFAAVPIDLGPASDQVFLVLYGTGIRAQRTSSASLGGTANEVLFAGAVEGLAGLDQVNVRVPRSLSGRGEIDVVLTVDGRATNTVRINVR
ncbi:MAG: hypothetical protein HYR56_06660 [Acidobacteria bacterium]|nr:hypothetical protein [Acidobacteriota bacterium]MBI3426705.1 hypothetical protein [Acidobacteriota bacterium]